MRCTAPRNALVPHGVDNDVLLGLVNAVVLQGMPQDDTVRLTTRELLQLSGITPSARAYRNLQASLRRLQHTAYDVTDSWYDGSRHRWRSVSFSLIVRLGAEDNTADVTNAGQWRAQTLLAIRLDDSLISNIRAGHILPLDFEMLARLSQPLTRNLFRTLSFQRDQVGQEPVLAFAVPLNTWATHLGMHEMRLDTVMRALKPAHEELIAIGFLREVEYRGRGKTRMVHYTFASTKSAAVDPEAIAVLARYGVSGGRALTLAQAYGSEAVQRAVSVLEALLQTDYRSKIRNRAGMLSDILESPDKYDTLLTVAEKTTDEARAQAKPTQETSEEGDSETSTVPRKARSAHVILLGQYDDTAERRELRDRAAALYVAERVSSLDLIGLLNKETAAAQAQIQAWEQA
ncbi:hypothetical protein DR_A0369 [Deinococcus radiodurans R1 = ATCC 13939 = DSM 20539]|uniref:Uncharacterized protein n=1 Tax=Deinococcus radiodurans (strain ATCC 13939 / DSM 20539 / JCM 16871 / CCUG 27074 / LMG 4051 / NBRC 15346 / NCIMB 9279 / VKM B-1422 / R1) TaxID=243230 RepID=Q9RYE9_DEIRA|nr:hypothetical protein DR_A0369 [Deinococcus radiodurans R1 = ATCC 13939 = DSM 20539]